MIIAAAIAVLFYLAAPAIGAWLAGAGVAGPAVALILNVAPKAIVAVIKSIPTGPLTEHEKAIVNRHSEDARNPFLW